MKSQLLTSLLLSTMVTFSFCDMIKAQQQFTPYDDLPGISKNYKPMYNEEMPYFAKLLYTYPINLRQVSDAFNDFSKKNPAVKNAQTRYFKLWHKAVIPYTDTAGTIHLPDNNAQVISDQDTRNITHSLRTGGNSDWSFWGPKETFWLNESGSTNPPKSCPWQVNVYAFDVSETDPNILFAGTETGFVNKTVDKGLNWQLVGSEYYFGGAVTAVAIHPIRPEVVYVSAGQQIHKTTDGGLTWRALLSTEKFSADRLRIDRTNPDKIYAAAAEGLFISDNEGALWVRKWSSPCTDVEIKPDNSNIITALTRTSNLFSLVQSVNGGASFSVQGSFPSNITYGDGGLLAVSPANPDIMLALLLGSNNTPYLLKGTVTNNNWSWKTQATGRTPAFAMDNGQGYFDLALDIAPDNENIIMAGTSTLYKSTNGGLNFSPVGGYSGNFSIHPDIQDIKMLRNGEMWVSTDGGMNLSLDNFTYQTDYFVRVNGLVGSDFWGFDQGWNEDIVVGGRYHNGNTAISDFYGPKALRMGGAESPTGWVLQGKSRHVAFDDLGSGWILPLKAEGKPEGRFSFTKYPNMDEYGGRRGNLATHPNYYGTFFLGEENGIWKTEDSGQNWDLLSTFPGRVRYVQISYSNPLVLFADIETKGLYKSTDGGLTWQQKPALTSSPNGNASWGGRLFFVLSPSDDNTIYACLQNGTWSADIGKIFKSTDGGETWSNWTGTVAEYLKSIVIQPGLDGRDIVYLFTNARNNRSAKVFYRTSESIDWLPFQLQYPAGFSVNHALPFFRDSKLRVAGNGGVWESPLQEAISPLINPWVEKAEYSCIYDTIMLDDHSIIDYKGVSWQWKIEPAPVWINNVNIRNPKIVTGKTGSFNVTLTITKDGIPYTKSLENMFATKACPSIEDCSNPAALDKKKWKLIYADSEEVNDPGRAIMSFDDDPATLWHTRWSTGNDPYPHEIQVALGDKFQVSQFTYQTRQDGQNGRVKDYRLYISSDSLVWGAPVSEGQFTNTSAPQTVKFTEGVIGKYFKFESLSEVNGGPWTSAAEFSLVGCLNENNTGLNNNEIMQVAAFPVPTDNMVRIKIPTLGPVTYSVTSTSGNFVYSSHQEDGDEGIVVDISNFNPGVYLIIITDSKNIRYRAKIIKS